MADRKKADSFERKFRTAIVAEGVIDDGYHWQLRFPNDLGASVIRNDRGPHKGKWETALLSWDGDKADCVTTPVDRPDQTLVYYYDDRWLATDWIASVQSLPGLTGIEVLFAAESEPRNES